MLILIWSQITFIEISLKESSTQKGNKIAPHIYTLTSHIRECTLVMNLEYKDGQNEIEAVVYEGAFINGSHQIKRRINGTNIVPARNLAHL